ncbi:MAG: hypothetical protein R6X02_07770 [Enhygromyxa sp.]
MSARPALLVMLMVCACGPGTVEGSGSEAGAEAADESETDTSEAIADLPPEPDCPGSLGELVSCECAFVEGCTIESVDGQSCALACEQPAACERVRCDFDWAHGEPVCVELYNPDALACVLETLLLEPDLRVDLGLHNTYPSIAWDDHRSLIRLDETQWLLTRDFDEFEDAGGGASKWGARVVTLSDAELQACADADFAEARFQCLFDLGWSAAQPCVDPQMLSCGQ